MIKRTNELFGILYSYMLIIIYYNNKKISLMHACNQKKSIFKLKILCKTKNIIKKEYTNKVRVLKNSKQFFKTKND